MIRAVCAAGAPAPEVLDEVTLEGRFGIVLRRLDGPTLLQLSRSGAMTPEQVGSVLATLSISVHKTAPPPEVLFLRDRMDGALRLSSGMLPEHIATGILALIERLAPGDGLCHGDVHPGNVIMTADGPRLIDWGGATRAPAGLDLACCRVINCRARPGNRRRSGAAARERCGHAVRVRAAGRHVPRGADGGDGALPADHPRLRPPRAGGEPCPAGTADPGASKRPCARGTDTRRAWCVGIDGAAIRRPSPVAYFLASATATPPRAPAAASPAFPVPLLTKPHSLLAARVGA